MTETIPPPLTPADLALLAAHVGITRDGRAATDAAALAYLCLHTPRQRAALVAELWRRYGPDGAA